MSREKTRLFCPGTSDLNGTGKGLIVEKKRSSDIYIDLGEERREEQLEERHER